MLRDEKGFTLLEIIVSITILATVILTLVQMFSGSINQATQAERYLNGVYLAQQKFSQLELDNFKADTTENLLEGTFENHEGYHWQLEVVPYESALNNVEARIKIEKVSLRVYWEDRGKEKEVTLVSLKTVGETHTASASQLEPASQTNPTAPKTPEKPEIKNLNPSASP